MPMLFRLVSEEVGAKKPGYRRGATFSLCCLVLLGCLRGFAHRRALSLLDAYSYSEENPIGLGAFPSLANPFVWTGVVETDSGFRVLEVNALEDSLEPEMARVYRKPETSPALAAALKTHTAEVFLGFARFPWAQVGREEDGFTVTIRDLRFVALASQTRGFVAEIRLDNDLRVHSESFHFRAPAAPGKF